MNASPSADQLSADQHSADQTRTLSLAATLDLLAQTIVEELGFDAAVINYVRSPERVDVVSVAGPVAVREYFLGTHDTLGNWIKLLDACEEWGQLRFLEHPVAGRDVPDMLSWMPSIEISDDPEAWHPEDALFVPLNASDGRLLGILSVDLPRSGTRPDRETQDSLAAFGVSAALAIEHATLRERAERSEELFREVFSTSPVGMALVDSEGVLRFVNVAMCDILARGSDELTGSVLEPFIHPDDRESTIQLLSGPQATHSVRREQRYLRPDGSVVSGELTSTYIGGGRAVLQLRDVTEEREAAARLKHLASHDPVTAVGNRSLVLERLTDALERPEVDRERLALLFVDLNGFKRINDAYSHAVGDQVLYTIAQRLRAVVRDEDTVARWGGDEFIVLADGVLDHATAFALASRIEEAVSRPIVVHGNTLFVTSSTGVAFSEPGDGVGPEELLRNADTAMYRSKRDGRSRYSVFDQSLRESSERLSKIERIVYHALEWDRLVVHYQPIVELGDGKIVAFEALMRLRDDDGQLLHPDDFLAIASDTGQLVTMEQEAMRRAFGQAVAWAEHDVPLRVSVNLAVRQLSEIDDFEERVSLLLAETGLPPAFVTFEITEHAFFEVNARTVRGMNRLVDSGVSFSVDDFGTGFGSMTYLRAMPIHEIKIDRSFIQHTPRERASSAIVRAHALLAQELGVRCVAEGVETAQEHAFLLATGIEFGQGYFYERPLSAEGFSRLI